MNCRTARRTGVGSSFRSAWHPGDRRGPAIRLMGRQGADAEPQIAVLNRRTTSRPICARARPAKAAAGTTLAAAIVGSLDPPYGRRRAQSSRRACRPEVAADRPGSTAPTAIWLLMCSCPDRGLRLIGRSQRSRRGGERSTLRRFRHSQLRRRYAVALLQDVTDHTDRAAAVAQRIQHPGIVQARLVRRARSLVDEKVCSSDAPTLSRKASARLKRGRAGR